MGKPGTSLCFPSFLTHRKSSLKSQRRGINNDFGNSKLACTTLVQSHPRSCIAEPLLLPQSQELLVDPEGQVHPLVLNKTLKLMAWKISGKTWLRKEFQTRLPILSQIPEDQALQLITNQPGKNGLAGVVKDRLIQLHAV